MFITSPHSILPYDALDNRRLRENFYHFAGAFAEIGSDQFARKQLSRRDFTLGTFIELEEKGWKIGNGKGQITGDTGDVMLCIDSQESLDISGDYCITWDAEFKVRKGDCRFITCQPFMGTHLVGSAEDSFYSMGYIQNMEPIDSGKRSAYKHNPREVDFQPYEKITEVWDTYGKKGYSHNTEIDKRSRVSVKSEVGLAPGSDFIHLSGVGFINLPRASGNVGLIAHTQTGSRLAVTCARISLRKRSR